MRLRTDFAMRYSHVEMASGCGDASENGKPCSNRTNIQYYFNIFGIQVKVIL